MTYIKLTNNQLVTIKELPNNLNNKLSSNISGIFLLNKVNDFKQIILDFQHYNTAEFFSSKTSDSIKVHILEHIRNADTRNNSAITFEIAGKATELSIFNGYHLPGLYQFIKCSMYSIYRKVFNHILFTGTDKIYVLSLKKTHYYHLLNQKRSDKIKMKEMFHILMKMYMEIYHNSKDHEIKIPEQFSNLFNIQKFGTNGILFEYINYK